MNDTPAEEVGDESLTAEQILEAAIEKYNPIESYVLFSGGKDSSVTLDYMWKNHRDKMTAALHIDTGTGIPQTQEFVKQFCSERGIPLEIVKTPFSYEEIVLKHGFPGPAAHRFMYIWLKEKPLKKFTTRRKGKFKDKIMLITGVRRAESIRRMGTTNPVQQEGCRVWVAPLINWSNETMQQYRDEYNVPISEPSITLHLSGECLCGSFAKPGEIGDIAIFYPDVAKRIKALEDKVKAAGQKACIWGVRPPGSRKRKTTKSPGPLCVGCVNQDEVLESYDDLDKYAEVANV